MLNGWSTQLELQQILVEVVVQHHKEYCFEVLISWSGVGCSYVTGTQVPTSRGKKVLLSAKHAQTALLLSLFIPSRSASLAIWKGIVNSSHLTFLSVPLFSPFPSPYLFTCTIFSFVSPHLPPDYYCLCSVSLFSQLYFFILSSSLRSNSDFFVSLLRVCRSSLNVHLAFM